MHVVCGCVYSLLVHSYILPSYLFPCSAVGFFNVLLNRSHKPQLPLFCEPLVATDERGLRCALLPGRDANRRGPSACRRTHGRRRLADDRADTAAPCRAATAWVASPIRVRRVNRGCAMAGNQVVSVGARAWRSANCLWRRLYRKAGAQRLLVDCICSRSD